MSEKNYILVSMEDEKTEKIATILGSKVCKKILDVLTKKEYSEKELADTLKIPINTIEYNLKKLLHAELVEKTKQFFWSKKGKKISVYRLSNKSIIISPKSKISSAVKAILPVVLLSGLGSLIVKKLAAVPIANEQFAMKSGLDAEIAANAPAVSDAFFMTQTISPEAWFFIGSCFAIVLFVLLSLRHLKVHSRSKTLTYLKGGKN
jgi:DNA-binding transcriptional ArsR family regulator